MNIVKRTGGEEPYRREKIIAALKKAFQSVQEPWDDALLAALLARIEHCLAEKDTAQVEEIQDLAEQALMESGRYAVARSYILYRERRTALRRQREGLLNRLSLPELQPCLRDIQRDFPQEEYALTRLEAKYATFRKEGMTADEELDSLIRAAAELTNKEAPRWEFIAARLLSFRFDRKLHGEEAARRLGSFYEKLVYLTDQGLYGDYILQHYSQAEIDALSGLLRPERDRLFTYAGLDLLLSRYVIHDRRHVPLESPQELYLGIALHLPGKAHTGVHDPTHRTLPD